MLVSHWIIHCHWVCGTNSKKKYKKDFGNDQNCDIIPYIGNREMREGIKTSLVSIMCVVAASVANAAPTVRTIGGAGTYDSAASAANATAAARAGSLRSTGGYIRPTASVSTGAATTTGTTTTGTTVGGSVSTGGATVGRVASSPRLSIGKYIGAPKSISTSGGTGSDLTGRVEQLESDVATLQTDKQDALQDSTYITVAGDELVLDLERIKEDLEIGDGTDGREVEMGTNDDGLLWRYVGDTEWQTLITWDTISEKLDFDGIDQTINQSITNLRTEMLAALDTKVDKDQGVANAGKVLAVDDNGLVAPSDNYYSKTEIDQQIQNITDSQVTTADLDTKVDKDQGIDNAGKTLVIGADGMVVPSDIEFATTDDLDNLGDLAYEDTVSTTFIDDGAVERAKLADDIAGTLTWVEGWKQWWDENRPGDGQYVMSVDENGNQLWFRVITADDDSSAGGDSGGGTTPTEP